MIHYSAIILVLLMNAVPQASVAGTESPAWCTAKELSVVESMICSDASLGKADGLMQQLYEDVLSFRGQEGQEGMWPSEVISNQQDWLLERNVLSDKTQLLGSYVNRIEALIRALQVRLQD